MKDWMRLPASGLQAKKARARFSPGQGQLSGREKLGLEQGGDARGTDVESSDKSVGAEDRVQGGGSSCI